jgi:hypothetical protein
MKYMELAADGSHWRASLAIAWRMVYPILLKSHG